MRQLLVLATGIAMFACASTATAAPTAVAAKTVKCGGKKATIKGTKKADRLKGTRKADVIAGLGGKDTIKGLRGNDVACGGDGNDKLLGGAGRDTLIGGKGRDDCRGGPGKDKIRSCETGDTTPKPPGSVGIAPTVTTSSGSAAFVEGAGPVPLDSALSVTDLDSLTLSGATVHIGANHAGGQDVLAVSAPPGISGSFNDTTGTLTLTGSASVTDYQTALRSVTYSNSSDSPSTATRTLSVQVTDASALPSNSAARDVTLAATNDAPVVTTSAGPLGYAEGDAFLVVDPGVSVADPDDTDIERATVSISAGFDSAKDQLAFADQNGIVGSWDNVTGVLTLTGPASVADFQTALRSVRLDTTTTEGGSKAIEFRVDDGDGYGTPATKDVTIGPPNEAATVDANPTATELGYTENAGAVAISPDLTVTDPDSGQAGATVSISGNYDSTQDSLGFTNQNGIAGSYDSGTGVLTLTGTASTADYQTALRSVTYTNSSESPSIASRTVSFQTTDTHGAPSNTSTRDIDITSVNDAPTAVNDTGTTDEDTTLNVLAPGVLANDTDPDAGDTFTVTELNGSPTLTGPATGGGTVTINADGSYSFDPGTDFQDLATGQDGTASFTYTMQDASGAPSTATVTITVTGVSDAPDAGDDNFDAVGNTGLFVSTTKPAGEAGKEISGSVLDNDSDPDSDSADLNVEPQTDAATTLGGRVSINGDGTFTYHPDAGDTGVDSFNYRVCDNTPCDSSTDANSTGTVNITLTGKVWYVKNDSAAGGDGTSEAPFDTLAEAETVSGSGDTVFVYQGDGTTTGYDTGFAMKATQRLIGEANGLSVDPDAGGPLGTVDLLAATADAYPRITATNEDVIDLDDGNELRSVGVDPGGTGGGIAGGAGDTGGGTIHDVAIIDFGTAGTQPGVELDGTTGTFNISDLGVTPAAGATGIRLNNAGTVIFDPDSSNGISAEGAPALDVTGVSFGSGDGSAFTTVSTTGSPNGGVKLVNTTGALRLGSGTGTNLNLATTSSTAPAFRLSNTGSVTVPASGNSTINANGGAAVDIDGAPGSELAFDTVSSTDSFDGGISITATGGDIDFSATGGSITGASGIGFRTSDGAGDITYPGAINNGGGDSLAVLNRTGGTVALSGAITDSGDSNGGIALGSNTGGSTVLSGPITLNTVGSPAVVFGSSDGHTLTLSGGLSVQTTSGLGLWANNSGTLNVTGSGNTIQTNTGTALTVANTDVGATPLTFQSISSNGAANGIRLDNTGSNSALTVTGNGGTCTAANTSGCSGGVIQNTTGSDDATTLPVGAGIALRSTRGVSLTRMRVTSSSNYGIRGSTVTGLAIANSLVNGTNGTTALTANKDSSAKFNELTGTVSMTDTEMSGGYTSNLLVSNTTGTLNATLTNFKSGTIDSVGGDDAVQFEGLQTSTNNVTVQNSAFTTATGDVFQYIGNGSGGGALNFIGNAVSNNEPSIANGGGGVTLSGGARGTATMTVQGNTFRDSLTSALTVVKSREAGFFGNFGGTITQNTIGVTGVANSGSLGGSGIAVTNFGSGNQSLTVTNNNVRQYNSSGMTFTAGAGVVESGQLNLNISGNTVAEPGTNPSVTLFQGIRVESGVTAGDNFATCVNFGTNSITGSSDAANKDFRLLANNSDIKLPGYTGAANDDAAVLTFVKSQIGGGADGTVARGTGTWIGGVTCP